MTGYLIFLLLLFLTDYMYQTEKPKLICFFVITTIFAGIRYGIGYDYWAYFGILNELGNNLLMPLRFEFLSASLMRFCAFTNVYLFFLLTSLITIGLYCWGIYKKECDSFVAFLFYLSFPFLFFNHVSTVRQGIAHALVFICIMMYKDKRLVQVLLILIAGLFHESGFVGILILIPWEKVSTKLLAAMFFASFFAGEVLIAHVGHIPIASLARNLVATSAIEGEKLKYLTYLIAIICIYYRDKIPSKDNNAYYTALVILGASLYAIFANNSTLAQRVCQFFFGASIVVIPTIAKHLQMHRFYLIGTFLLLFFLNIYVGSTPCRPQDENKYAPRYPYRTIFDDSF